MPSLQDQLLKAGMIDKKKAKQVAKEKRKQAKQLPKGQKLESESKKLAEKARREKAEKSIAENNKLKQQAEEKAIVAQIKQLAKRNQIDRSKGDIAYQFTDGTKIKKIHISGSQQEQLVRGLIAIVKIEAQYLLVPAAVADKISQRDNAYVIVRHVADKKNNKKTDNCVSAKGSSETLSDEEFYAQYEVPDDLMW